MAEWRRTVNPLQRYAEGSNPSSPTNIPMDKELKAIQRLQEYIDKRISAGASEEELDKLYDDINSLKQNYLLGELLGEE